MKRNTALYFITLFVLLAILASSLFGIYMTSRVEFLYMVEVSGLFLGFLVTKE